MSNTNLPPGEASKMPEQPVNQWHANLLKQANDLPVSQKFWQEKPKQIKPYDWGSIEYRR